MGKPVKNAIGFLMVVVVIWCVGCGTFKGPHWEATVANQPVSGIRMVVLEGENLSRKDATGKIVTLGDKGWPDAPHYFAKEKKPFTGSLVIPYLNNGTNNVRAIISFDKGKQHGPSTVWHKNGRKQAEEEFAQGESIKGTYWLDDGKPDPKAEKDSGVAESTKLLARLAVESMSTRGAAQPLPERDPKNIRFDNWLRFNATPLQWDRHQTCMDVLTARLQRQGIARNEAIYRAYCVIRSPLYRNSYHQFIVQGTWPQALGQPQGNIAPPKPIVQNPPPQPKPVVRPPQPRPVVPVPAPAPIAGYGSGFFISRDGYLITNHHVVKGAKRVAVKVGGKERHAEVVQLDQRNDLALLKVKGTFEAIPITVSGSVSLGQDVFTIGYPIPGIQGLRPKLTRGSVSSLAGLKDNPYKFQIQVPIQAGNSGGPLLDLRGNLVGVVSSSINPKLVLKLTHDIPQNVNYAIKSSVLKLFLDNIPVKVNLVRPYRPGITTKFQQVVNAATPACVMILVY